MTSRLAATEDEIREEVWKTLQDLNECWTKGDGSGLARFFHPRMVAIVPTARERLIGRDACLASWTGFVQAAKILSWKEIEPHIELFGDTAIVTYRYELRFEMNGQTIDGQGRDMFTFIRENGRWWAVADQFSPNP